MTITTKAIILVGGYGTRLRPLTITKPKPLIKFCNKKMLYYAIEELKKIGVNEIILAVNYMYKDFNIKIDGIKIILSIENEPLGTAGPLALAKKYLNGDSFFVINSDVVCEFPFFEMLNFHRNCKSLGTILTKKIENCQSFGIIEKSDTNLVLNFLEKPENIDNKPKYINAGVYILEPEVLDMIPLKNVSLEREIFPKLAKMKELYSYPLKSFWMDIGEPERYLEGQKIFLDYKNINFLINTKYNNLSKFEYCVIGDNV